ncbi:MAG TPA: extradiol ring-cleavage dioxygenase [Deinococcales bacterium]|nr:extradiol ring-cleavage dioxygenase [Deinococcales bacterium]
MSLVFACVAPHGFLVLPLIAGGEGGKATATRAAMVELGRRVEAARPDTIVVVTPHGLHVEGHYSLLDSDLLRGETGYVERLGGNDHSFTLQFRSDRDLNRAIAARARELSCPTLSVRNDLPWVPGTLDFAVTTPLWFMGAFQHPLPRLVVACPPERDAPDREAHLAFGRAVREAAEGLGRRVVLVASADLGHAHDPGHEYGLEAASAEFDAVAREAVPAQDAARLLEVNREWLKRAKTDAYVQLLAALGAVQGLGWRGELLSYEVPTYFGMMCVSFTPAT